MEERVEHFNDSINAQRIAAELKQQLLDGKEPLRGSAQHEYDLRCWLNFILGVEPQPKSAIELGTGTGVFSKFIYGSFDNYVGYDLAEPMMDVPNIHRVDILNNPDIIKMMIFSMPKPLILYCDNGNKPREVELFSKYLETGDYLATHDYHIEIHPSDIPTEFKPILNRGLTAFFIKT